MLWQFLDEGGVGLGSLIVLVLGLSNGWVGKLSLIAIIQVSLPALPWLAHPTQQTTRRRVLLLSHPRVQLICTHATRANSADLPRWAAGPGVWIDVFGEGQGIAHALKTSSPTWPVADGKVCVGRHISLTLAIHWHTRKGAGSFFHSHRPGSPAPQPTRSALVCCLSEVLCLLSPVLQLVGDRTSSPAIIVALGSALPSATVGKGQGKGGHFFSSLKPPHSRWGVMGSVLLVSCPRHSSQQGQLYCPVEMRYRAGSPDCCCWWWRGQKTHIFDEMPKT